MKLSKIERYKQELMPANFEEKLPTVDYANVDEQTRFYLKNFGIYNIKLRPEVYMLRIRIDGGRISPHQLLRISQIAKEESLSIIVTARAQLELHGIAPDKVYDIYSTLQSSGVDTYQTLTDNFRAIVTDPLDEIESYSKIDIYPIIKEIRNKIMHRREWIGTIPRKFNTAVIGVEYPRFNPWGNDLLMALSEKDGRLGFNIYIGGKNSECAKSADIFVTPKRASDIFIAIATLYLKHGPRESRSKARLYHLAEESGMPKIRELISQYYEYRLESEGRLIMKSSSLSQTNRLEDIEIRSGFYGEFSADEVIYITQTAIENNLEIRLSPEQSIYITGSKIENNKELQVTACAGARYCPLSLWDIKRDIDLLPVDRLKELGISIGFSGCLKGCGRHYHNDIGLIGLRTNLYAPTERAVRVYLGALQSITPSPAILLFYSVPLRSLNILLDIILDDFQKSGYPIFEEFSINILRRCEQETLQLRYAITKEYNTDSITRSFLNIDKETLIDHIYTAYQLDREIKLIDAIKIITHKSWDI